MLFISYENYPLYYHYPLVINQINNPLPGVINMLLITYPLIIHYLLIARR